MSGVFLSYSRADRDLAERIVVGLRGLGADVWWDEDMPGVDWRDELNRQLERLSAVLVIWTPASSGSRNVMAEARLGDRKEKLVNVICGVSSPPAPFDAINGLPLDGWTGAVGHHGWERVVRTVEDFLVKSGDARPGELMGALRERQTAIRERQQALSQAEEAFRDAKSAEGEASEASHAAETAFEAAEEQLGWVVSRRGAASLLRAAQGELDTASARREVAQATLQSAATALSSASRAMTRARSELERELGQPAARAPVAGDAALAEALRPAPEPLPGAPAIEASPPVGEHASGAAVETGADPAGAPLPSQSAPQPQEAPPARSPEVDVAPPFQMAEAASNAASSHLERRPDRVDPPVGETARRPTSGRRQLIVAAALVGLVSIVVAVPIGMRWHSILETERLANEGWASSEFELASLYDNGGGAPFLPRDTSKSEYWFEKLASEGDIDAQSYVAGDYSNGVGVAADAAKAVSWWEKVAAHDGDGVIQQDRAVAERSLGELFDRGGPNLSADPVQARAWYVKAAADGDKDASAWLAQSPAGAAPTNSIPP